MDKNLNTVARRSEQVRIRGEIFDLLPERCAYRRHDKTLLAADLHWGKSEIFQASGIAIPSSVIDDDLSRLSQAVLLSGANRLLVLGDLIHGPPGITKSVHEKVKAWRSRHPGLTFQVIRGNHDRRFAWPSEWGVDDVGTSVHDHPFLFTHDEPEDCCEIGSIPNAGAFVWTGHIHPVVHLSGGGDSLRVPCFVITDESGLLPAFSLFTGGASIGRSQSHRRVFAIAETAVIEV